MVLQKAPLCFLCFLCYDTVIIWPHGAAKLNLFLEFLNNKYPNIISKLALALWVPGEHNTHDHCCGACPFLPSFPPPHPPCVCSHLCCHHLILCSLGLLHGGGMLPPPETSTACVYLGRCLKKLPPDCLLYLRAATRPPRNLSSQIHPDVWLYSGINWGRAGKLQSNHSESFLPHPNGSPQTLGKG